MLGGRCADLLGRRRVFLAGTALFAFSSLACALADTRGLLLGARALQGFGGAVLSPATLSIVTSSFEAGPARNRAVGMWGAMGALGASSGALLGGLLTQGFGWPAIFAVNVPLGLLVIVFGLRVIPTAAMRHEGTRHFDVAGAVLVTAGLVSLAFGIVRTDTLGWGSTGVLAPLVGGVALLGGVPLGRGARRDRFRWSRCRCCATGQLRLANVIVILLYAAFFPVWFFLTLYLQQVLHYDAIEAGVSFLPMTLSIFVASTLAPRLVARFGARRRDQPSGCCARPSGMALLVGVSPHGSYLPSVLPGAMLSAIGMGLSLVPATIVAMQCLPACAERDGLGAAEHLAADGRSARAGGAVDDRRRPHPRRRRRRAPHTRSPTASTWRSAWARPSRSWARCSRRCCCVPGVAGRTHQLQSVPSRARSVRQCRPRRCWPACD